MYSEPIRALLAEHARLLVDVKTLERRQRPLRGGPHIALHREPHARARGAFRRRVPRPHARPQDLRSIRALVGGHRASCAGPHGIGHKPRELDRSLTHAAPKASKDFDALLERVHALGREVIAPAAGAVDRDARFPHEAFEALRGREAALLLRAGGVRRHGPRHRAGLAHLRGAGPVLRLDRDDLRDAPDPGRLHRASRASARRSSATTRARSRAKQLLLASATTEVGVGGDVRSSICAVEGRRRPFHPREEGAR